MAWGSFPGILDFFTVIWQRHPDVFERRSGDISSDPSVITSDSGPVGVL